MFEVKINYYHVFTIIYEFLASSENFIVKNLQTHSIFKLFFRYRITLDITVFKPRNRSKFYYFWYFFGKEKAPIIYIYMLNYAFLMRISLKKDCKFKLKIDF